MKKRISLLLSVWLAVSSALCGCNMVLQKNEKIQESSTDLATASEETEIQGVKKAEEQDISQVHLRDKDLLYSKEDETNVTTMYLTVSRGNDAENTNHSWEEINSYSVFDYEEMGVPRYQVALPFIHILYLIMKKWECQGIRWQLFYRWETKTALLQERLDTVRQYRMQLCRSGDKVPVKIPRKIIRSS